MQKAFTLIELLVVVLIIGILAAIALPQYQKAVWKSKAMQLVVAAKAISDEQNAYFLANGVYSEDAEEIPVYPKYASSSFKVREGLFCTLSYSNQGSSQRVSCSMSNPSMALQRYYKTGKLMCCSYPADNYAADKICEGIIGKSTWKNQCGESGCHCYEE